MCGICGIVSKKNYGPETINKMNGTMAHRGPDRQDITQMMLGDLFGAFGHCRLSILDLSEKGNQPMWSADQRLCIVLNGEIYNYRELRASLQKKGYSFQSKTDTETVLLGYRAWGRGILDKMDGMFAFAIYDKEDKSIFLARDRFGKKPLYYYDDGDTFIFASELKPFFQVPEIRLELNHAMMAYYMRHGYFPQPGSAIRQVKKLPSGYAMRYRAGRLELHPWWDPVAVAHKALENPIRNYKEARRTLEQNIQDAVKMRLAADVPVGVFLSSGIDSSIVAAMAQKYTGNVSTYTIGFDVPGYNEADAAKKIAGYLGTAHHEHYVGNRELCGILDKIPYFFDEPFGDTSMLPSMILARFAKQEITVALSGDGGDEVFGGYPQYAKEHLAQHFDGVGWLLHHLLPDGVARKLPRPVRRVVGNRNPLIKSQLVLEEELSIYKHLLREPYLPPYFAVEQQMRIRDWQFRRMLLDMKTALPGDMLHKVDRSSMSASLEVRSPLLDYKVAECAFRIPQAYKIKGRKQKRILRDIAYRYVPKELIDLPKRGFCVPFEHWMRTSLKERLTDYASSLYLDKQGVFQTAACQKMVRRFLLGDDTVAQMCWNFLMYQMWYETYRAGIRIKNGGSKAWTWKKT